MSLVEWQLATQQIGANLTPLNWRLGGISATKRRRRRPLPERPSPSVTSATLDADGYLFLVDRKKDMIVSGGVNIYPAEVEAVLLEHPAVGDAAVIGVPNEEWGEEVRAVGELRNGHAAAPELANGIIEHSRNRIAHYKCPRSVDFRDRLPRADNGKLYKRVLRDEYWAGKGRRL